MVIELTTSKDISSSATTPPVKELMQDVPTSTVHQARLQIYQPTRRPQWSERKIEAAWGSALIRGRIGQVHADIVEALCFCAEDHRVLEPSGHLQLLVDPYKVRVSVGAGKAYSMDTLWRMMSELREASITLEVPKLKLKVLGGILDRVEESPATRLNRFNGKPRQLWRVTFDPAFALMLASDMHLHYNPLTLAKIPTGVAQAIARLILTHRDQPKGGWLIDNLIDAVGAGGSSQTVRNRRRDVNKSADALAEIGIVVKDNRIYKKETKDISER